MIRYSGSVASIAGALLLVSQPVAAALLSVNTASKQASLAAYQTLYARTTNVPTGYSSPGGCNPGTTSAAFKDAAITRVNYYRTMAGVPAVAHNATFSRYAQAAAHLISVNNRYTHAPTPDMACYSADANEGARKSNEYIGLNGIAAIDGYMRDPGLGNVSVGHRRWILNPPARQFGFGDVSANGGRPAANALYVIDAPSNAAQPATRDGFVAWPPQGYVPFNVATKRWHFSKAGLDFTGATVSVTLGGSSVPVTVIARSAANALLSPLGYVSFDFNDQRDFARPMADQTYQVRIQNARFNGVSQTFNYNVILFDADRAVIPGDYNYDGLVNAADYTVIRDGLGTLYTPSDLLTWRASYGARATATSEATSFAVPEPNALVLLLAAASVARVSRRRPASWA